MLAGALVVPGDFAHLRHAHSHGAVYLVVFPLCVLAWSKLGIRTVGRRVMWSYYLAAAVAIVTFSVGGYSLGSIIASTVVAVVWLWAAFLGRRVLRDRCGAVRVMPLAFVFVTSFVPPIAIVTQRDPALASALAHSFLAMLFLMVATPAALERIGARRLDARAYAPAAGLAALHLGVWPSPLAAVGLAVVGVQVGVSVWRSDVDAAHRMAWTLFAGGALGLALMGVPPYHTLVGGLHFLLLGPLFASLVPLPPRFTWLVTISAAGMALSLTLIGVVRAFIRPRIRCDCRLCMDRRGCTRCGRGLAETGWRLIELSRRRAQPSWPALAAIAPGDATTPPQLVARAYSKSQRFRAG